MEFALAILVGAFFFVAIYLILSKAIIRMLLGVAVLGNAVNLLIFTAGRLTREVPPIVPEGELQIADKFANPLPQALILTAIVIGFALFTFLLVLGYRAYQELAAKANAALIMSAVKDMPKGGNQLPMVIDCGPDSKVRNSNSTSQAMMAIMIIPAKLA